MRPRGPVDNDPGLANLSHVRLYYANCSMELLQALEGWRISPRRMRRPTYIKTYMMLGKSLESGFAGSLGVRSITYFRCGIVFRGVATYSRTDETSHRHRDG